MAFSLPTGLGPCKITGELFKNRNDLGLPDVDILVLNKEGKVVKKFEAHKDVLGEKSSVMRDLIDKKVSELDPDSTSRIVLEITDFSHEVIEQLLTYMYMGVRPRHLNQKDFSLGLLECAIANNIVGLIILCQNMLGERIPTLEWEHLYKVLEMGKCEDGSNKLEILMNKVKEYYWKNENTLRKSRVFLVASENHPKIFFEKLFSTKYVGDPEDSFLVG